jgi:hypothetical protein
MAVETTDRHESEPNAVHQHMRGTQSQKAPITFSRAGENPMCFLNHSETCFDPAYTCYIL